MIPYKVFPMFQLGPFHINMYGIMFAFGVGIATFLAARAARKQNINTEIIYDLVLYLLLGTIIGARLFYLLFYWPDNIPITMFDIISIWKGGLAFFGGFIGAVIAGFWYIRKNKLNFWKYADLFTIPLIIGHISGRFGDYFTGGHPGKITDLPWAIYLDNASRHPVVLYEILGLIFILIILFRIKKRIYFVGSTFLSYIVLYSTQRIVLDFFRIESTDPRAYGVTPTQYIVVILFVVASFMLIKKYKTIKALKI